MKIHCSHCSDGCEWVGELGNLHSHLNSDEGCGYIEVRCPRRCTYRSQKKGDVNKWWQFWLTDVCTIKRKDVQYHMAYECSRRPYKCEHCSFHGTYEDVTETHYDMCLELPLSCPNKCDAPSIKRKDMCIHRSMCPNEKVECPFKEVGCNKDVCRSGFDDHMTSDVQQHLLLMMKAYEEMKLKVENHDKQLQAKRR